MEKMSMQNAITSHKTHELEERIANLEQLGDAELGTFTQWDWWVCILGAVVIPAILLWWFA